jgi:hypothetical protein
MNSNLKPPWPGKRTLGQALRLLAMVALTFSASAPSASANLVINATFDSSITGNANAAQLQSDVNAAIGIYQSLFTDNITVSILFRYSTTAPDGSALGSNTLAQSNYTLYSQVYGTYITALTNDKTTANDNTAVANLPAAGSFPNSPTRITVSSADGRAVGLATAGGMNASGTVGTGGTYDGIVTMNSSQPFQLDRTGGIASTKYDIMQSIEHEIDEVLGLGSILPNTTDYSTNNAVRPEDLFRYKSAGTLSLTGSGSATSYFSINGGVNKLASFNQNSNGDYGDWGTSATPLVQLAFSSKGTQSDVFRGSPEGVALDVIGYDLKTVPEPTSLALMGAGLVVMSGYGWFRRKPSNNTPVH